MTNRPESWAGVKVQSVGNDIVETRNTKGVFVFHVSMTFLRNAEIMQVFLLQLGGALEQLKCPFPHQTPLFLCATFW